MIDLNRIREHEGSMKHWKDEALMWWRRYIKNVMMLKRIRAENRKLRILLQDYVEETEMLREELNTDDPPWTEPKA